METSEILYQRVKQMVEQRGITINKMLNACGLNASLMTDVKNKGSIPSAEKIGRIADYLGVSVDYLLGRIDAEEGFSVVAANPGRYDFGPLTEEELEKLSDYLSSLRRGRER